MRIVAIDARHGSFRQTVLIRPLEFAPLGGVALATQLVGGDNLAPDQRLRRLVHAVAGGAGDGASRVRALNPADMRRLVEVTLQANLVNLRRWRFTRIDDVFRRL